MKKTSLLMVLGLAVVLASAAAPKANAAVVVGVGIGGPVYVHPVRTYGYIGPRYVAPGYVARPYFAPGPFVAVGPAPSYRRAYVPAPYVYGRVYGRRFVSRRGYYGNRR